MDGIRIAAALAMLAFGPGAPKSDRVGAAPGPEKKIACKDGTFADAKGENACEQHGGPGAPEKDAQGPARTSQPPNLRGHDTPAHASKYSAFGGKRNAKNPNKPGKKKVVDPGDKPLKNGGETPPADKQ